MSNNNTNNNHNAKRNIYRWITDVLENREYKYLLFKQCLQLVTSSVRNYLPDNLTENFQVWNFSITLAICLPEQKYRCRNAHIYSCMSLLRQKEDFLPVSERSCEPFLLCCCNVIKSIISGKLYAQISLFLKTNKQTKKIRAKHTLIFGHKSSPISKQGQCMLVPYLCESCAGNDKKNTKILMSKVSDIIEDATD